MNILITYQVFSKLPVQNGRLATVKTEEIYKRHDKSHILESNLRCLDYKCIHECTLNTIF